MVVDKAVEVDLWGSQGRVKTFSAIRYQWAGRAPNEYDLIELWEPDGGKLTIRLGLITLVLREKTEDHP